jgi:hypothetical protein
MNKPKKRIGKPVRPTARNAGKINPVKRHPTENLGRKPAARRPIGRVAKKSRKALVPKPKRSVEGPVNSVRVKVALDDLARAQADLTAKGIDLLNVAHDIGRVAAAKLRDELLQSLIQENLLQDLEQLRVAASTSTLPADLRLLPEAVLNWFCRHLELSQYLERNQKLDVPAERLSQYDLQGPAPDHAKALVTLQVLAPGWKCQGRTIISPLVTVAVPVAPPRGG